MTFNPKNFRRIEDDLNFTIRESTYSTLILIKANGDAEYARTRGDKDQLISQFIEGEDLLLWAWIGQHKTDIFMLDQGDLDRWYSKPK